MPPWIFFLLDPIFASSPNPPFDRLVSVVAIQNTRIDFPILDWPKLGRHERFPGVSYFSPFYQKYYPHWPDKGGWKEKKIDTAVD
jgi:hypothetical protein